MSTQTYTTLDVLVELHKHPDAWRAYCIQHRWLPVTGPRATAPPPSPEQVARRIEAHAAYIDATYRTVVFTSLFGLLMASLFVTLAAEAARRAVGPLGPYGVIVGYSSLVLLYGVTIAYTGATHREVMLREAVRRLADAQRAESTP